MKPEHEEFVGRLREARALIVAGWVQGVYSNKAGCYCIQGALSKAGIEERVYRLQVGKRTHGPKLATANLIRWNDADGRTKEEVIACLDNSIAALATP